MLIIQIALGIVLGVGILVLIKKINEKSELNRATNYYSEQDRERMKWDWYSILIMLALVFVFWFFSLILTDYTKGLISYISAYVFGAFSIMVICFVIYVKIKERFTVYENTEDVNDVENSDDRELSDKEKEEWIRGEVLPLANKIGDELHRKKMIKFLKEAGVDIDTKQSVKKIDSEVKKWEDFIKKQN